MIDQANSPTTGQAINVGIYGCTKAGKTRFLFQLLNRWERNRRLLGQSETCQEFLARVESEIEKHGGSMPTVATTEGIRVKVRRDRNDPPVQLVFRDLRGELLSEELDQIASLNRNGVIPTHVQQCDAFLFFFDPASSENPADIDKHHRRELKRATMFIEYVLNVRENRHLPIIFVQTHLDRWENDADIRSKADRWMNDVHAELVELYDSRLRSLYPKGIVGLSRIAFRVSSVGNTPEADKRLEEVVDRLIELVAESKSYQHRLRKQSRYLLIAGAVVLSLLPFVVWLLSSMEGLPSPPKKGNDRIAIAEMSEQEVVTKLDELELMLKAHSRGARLPSVEEAKKFNHHLRWLAQRLEPDSGGTTKLSDETTQRMRSALASLAKLMQNENILLPSAKDLTPILAAYLEDLPDLASVSPELAAVQGRYWKLQREQVVDEVASIIKRRHEVGSRPIDTLGEVVSKLRHIEQEVGRCKVFGPQARQDLLQEIQTAATFCEDRKSSKSYPATFRVASATFTSDKEVALAWRNITLQSGGQGAVRYFGLEPSRTSSDTKLSFTTKRQTYQIMLSIEPPLICILSVHDPVNDEWHKVHEFDLTSEPGPLAPLGLPLLRRDQREVVKILQWEGMELKLVFSGFPGVPPLIWDATASGKERKP